MIRVRKLGIEEWETVKALRLRALKDEPIAFGMSHQEAVAKSDTYWQEKTTEWDWYLAEDAGKSVGIIAIEYATLEKEKHCADLYSFYVIPECRRSGVGRLLLETVLIEIGANPIIVRVGLWVTATQTEAIALYQKFGFEPEGFRKKDEQINGVFYDAIPMVKFIR
jgi:ribosomal protein S18 acetylase RimI-like enzyme